MRNRTATAVLIAGFFAAAGVTHTGCSPSAPSAPKTLAQGGYNKDEMTQAIARARKEVDTFIRELAENNGSDFAVKAPISDGERIEHCWVGRVAFRNGKFTGKIANNVRIDPKIKLGQDWTVGKDEITDWMFVRDGKIHGNYTVRPLLKTMPPEKAEKIRARLANP